MLIGYVEFTDPSVPPRVYRTLRPSGAFRFFRYGSPDKIDLLYDIRYTWTGAMVKNLDGSNSDTSQFSQTVNGDLAGSAEATGTLRHFDDAYHWPYIYTKTTQAISTSGFNADNTACTVQENTALAQLLDEDTEELAMQRSSAAWGDWAGGLACCAAMGNRGAGQYAFSFAEAEVRVTLKGSAYQHAQIRVSFVRRPLGSVVYYPLETREYFMALDGAGKAEEVIVVPNQSGYETCASRVWEVTQ